MNFIQALIHELHQWQDETTWLTYDVVQDMLIRAAAVVIGDVPELSRVTLHHEYEPSDLTIAWAVLSIDREIEVILLPDDITTLRALLLTWDENRPARLGDALALPVQLPDGRVVTEVIEEFLKEGD